MKWKIACIQMDIAFGNPEENYKKAELLLAEAAKSRPDAVVLPELWTTGYDLTRLDSIADDRAETTLSFLKNCALKHGFHIIGGSVAKRTEDGVYNTLLVVDKNGREIKQYSKLHLFQLMDEHHYLKPGSSDGHFVLDDTSCAGFICYDIRFPEWMRTHAADGAEILFVAAEWPAPRIQHWKSLLISRAIENQAYVVAVNRSGSDPKNAFGGCSLIIDPWGEILGEGGQGEQILSAELDLARVQEVRGMIPVFQDRRTDFYK
ncbi:carbon-nitrogen family hydrolase [Peribacillus sp. SCS-37]|uniref:carbon-nitrogen family hydrolase n=1 Tax=Paraperibacillus esterisolvens TaxID=3115296 RepID=UPI003905A78B